MLIEHGASPTAQERAPLPVRALLRAGHLLASHTKTFAILKEPCATHPPSPSSQSSTLTPNPNPDPDPTLTPTLTPTPRP